MNYSNYYNEKDGVEGIAVIYNNFEAYIHHHPLDETYELIYGKALLFIDNKKYIIKAPYKTLIKKNIKHALKPLSPFVILKYSFPKGKFEDIKYTWLSSKL